MEPESAGQPDNKPADGNLQVNPPPDVNPQVKKLPDGKSPNISKLSGRIAPENLKAAILVVIGKGEVVVSEVD